MLHEDGAPASTPAPSAAPRVEATSLSGVALDSPRVRPEIDPDGPRPNILLLVVDCLRYDMVEPDEMLEVVRPAVRKLRELQRGTARAQTP